MTYSLIARDDTTGAIGIAVASRYFACGAAVPYVGRRAAVATQAFVNPLWGTEGRARLEAGEAAEDVLADFRTRDAGEAIRQCHMMDAEGRFAAYTGTGCIDWAGHRLGRHHSVAGNMLTGPEVVDATFETYERAGGMGFPERLLAAMEAGEAAGGDKRGRQAARVVIHRGEDYPWLDLRTDDHADPLAELRRLLDVAGERYLFVADALPTRDNFSGTPSREHIDRAIAEAEAKRAAEGRPSRSHASDPQAC